MQVFEYCETDLELVIKDRSLIFSAADVKSFMDMILRGLAFCHDHWVLHRDVKPNNFLVSPTGDCCAVTCHLSPCASMHPWIVGMATVHMATIPFYWMLH